MVKSNSSDFGVQSQYPSTAYRMLFGSRVYQSVQLQCSGELGQQVLSGGDRDGGPHKFEAVLVIGQAGPCGVGSMKGSGVQNDEDDTL